MNLKYVILSLFFVANMFAMEPPVYENPVPIFSETAITIIDVLGRKEILDPIILEHSKTLVFNIQELPGTEINLQDSGNQFLTVANIHLLAKALHFHNNKFFWKGLSVKELEILHILDDYFDVEIICKQITRELEKRQRNNQTSRIPDADLAQHKRMWTMAQHKDIQFNEDEKLLDLSHKNLRTIKDLCNIPFWTRRNTYMLDLSYNLLDSLDLDCIFCLFPYLKILKAEHCNIEKIKGGYAIPNGCMCLFAHNQINQVDKELLKNADAYVDLSDNEIMKTTKTELKSIQTFQRLNVVKELLARNNGVMLDVLFFSHIFGPIVGPTITMHVLFASCGRAILISNKYAHFVTTFIMTGLNAWFALYTIQHALPNNRANYLSWVRKLNSNSYLSLSNQQPFTHISSSQAQTATRKLREIQRKNVGGLEVLLPK